MGEQPIDLNSILNRVYKGPAKTGDSVDGLTNLGYGYDNANSVWRRIAVNASGQLDIGATFSGTITNDGTFAKETGGNLAALVSGVNINKIGGNAVTTTIPTSFLDTVVTGTLTTVGDVVQVSTANGYNAVGISISGTFGGATIVPEVSVDGVRFDGCTFFTVAGSTPLTSTGSVGSYQSLVGGMQTFQVRLSALASGGPISITLRASRALTSVMLDNGLPSGSNTIGNVGLNAGSNQIGTVLIRDTNGNVIGSASNRMLVDGSGVTQPISNSNLDVALSTRTKPSDQQHVIVDSGVTTGLTDTQLRATPVPVSGTVNPTTPTAILGFVTAVTTAGTRVQLASNACVAGIVQAPSTNTGIVYVGGSTVSATVFGAELQPGQASGIAIDNTSKLWIDAATNGDKVAFFGS